MTDLIPGTGFRAKMVLLFSFVAMVWALEALDWFLGGAMNSLGIIPRTVAGLWGIPMAPFLHGSFAHAASNSIPLLILGFFVVIHGKLDFFIATFFSIIIGGLGTWLIGSSNSVHLGASGVVFGYMGFLLAGGIFERSLKTIAIAIASAVLYGGILFGVLPIQAGVSWEGHLFGFLGGILAAKLMSQRKMRLEERI